MSNVRACRRCGKPTDQPQFCANTGPCIEAAFWAKVDKSGGPGACWPWRGSFSPDGYGKFMYRESGERVTARAHRMAMTLAGNDPGALLVCHHCDSPSCCNPAHFFLGTVRTNTDDKVAKGRQPKGIFALKPGQTKLSADDARAVRAARGDPRALDAFAEKFGYHKASIRRIARGAHLGYL